MALTHAFVSAKADGADATLVRPSDWNADHTGTLGIANGGTGQVLVDPGADRVLFWDESANAFTFLTVGTGLAITATTIAATASDPLALTTAAPATPAADTLYKDTMVKAWAVWDSAGVLLTDFNVSSFTRTGTGEYDVVFATAMASANYAAVATLGSGNEYHPFIVSKLTTGFGVKVRNESGTLLDQSGSFIVV